MSKITSASQLLDESGESPTIDFSMIHIYEVSGVQKACIYGVGSHKQLSMRTLTHHLLQHLNLKIVILMLEFRNTLNK